MLSLACWWMALSLLQTPEAEERAPPPRLAVLVVVDQMRGDQLRRLRPLLEGGLARFAERGRVYPDARLTWGASVTGAGHASLGSAAVPRRHGIVGNDWREGDARTQRYCCEDENAAVVGPQGVLERAPGRSARNLRLPGASELWKTAIPGARVVSLGAKDRAAILVAGHTADHVLWWDATHGGYVTSRAYAPQLAAWVVRFDAEWPARFFAGPFRAGWQPCASDAAAADWLASHSAPDAQPGERGIAGRASFPYPLPFSRGEQEEAPVSELSGAQRAALAGWVMDTPACDALTLDLAREALLGAELGDDERTDLLILCFSACDSVGHAFGPTSREVTDTLLRLDRGLGALFAQLDERLGPHGWVAALGADHGVRELPERDPQLVRFDARAAGRWAKELKSAVELKYGQPLVVASDSRGVWLSHQRCKESGLEPREVRAFVAAWIAERPAPFLGLAFTWEQLRDAALRGESALAQDSKEDLLQLEARSFDPERSPDVVLVPAPGQLIASSGTTHGTPYADDRSVALGFLGPMFAPAWIDGAASTLDVLPTLIVACGGKAPEGLDGIARDMDQNLPR